MLSELCKSAQRLIAGDTDSELIFHWLLARFEQARALADDRCISLSRMRTVMARSIRELDRRNAAVVQANTVKDPVARLNFLLTNGSIVVASRFRNSLHLLQRAQRHQGKLTRRVTIASEPTSAGRWQEVPEESVLSISTQGHVIVQPIVVID